MPRHPPCALVYFKKFVSLAENKEPFPVLTLLLPTQGIEGFAAQIPREIFAYAKTPLVPARLSWEFVFGELQDLRFANPGA